MTRNYRRGHKHRVTIGVYTFMVDSDLEERVLRRLNENGFADYWRPGSSIEHWSYNYTPDAELSVQEGNLTHRALVEIKPALENFYSDGKDRLDIARRMAGASNFYHFTLLLLYADKEQTWYQIDPKSYELTVFGQPHPGRQPIHKLKSPSSLFTVKGHKKFDKQYQKRQGPGMLLAKGIVAVYDGVFGKPKTKQKRRRR